MKRFRTLRNHFLTGLLVIIPFGVVTWILRTVVRGLWNVYHFIPNNWLPQVSFEDPLIAGVFNGLCVLSLTVGLVAAISLLGWISQQYLGAKLLQLIGRWIERIPVISTIYSSLGQLLKTFASTGGHQFSRVVYIEFPRKGLWSLAFVTGVEHGTAFPPGLVHVFLPTTPIPTSGFYLLVDEKEVKESHLTVEEALRSLISLGVVETGQVKVDS